MGDAMKYFPLIVLALTSFVSAAPKSVAVFELVNLSGKKEFNHLSAALPKSLRVSLLAGQSFQVAEPSQALKALTTPPAPGQGVPFSEALKAADKLKAEIAVIGSFALVGETIQINLEAVDTKTRRISTSASVSGPATGSDLFDLIDRICALMAERMTKDLPAETAVKKPADTVNVEEVYLSSSRKNFWFYSQCGAGFGAMSADVDGKNHSGFSVYPLIEFGYGFKRFRLRFSGTPPLFQQSHEDNSAFATLEGGTDTLLDYMILPGRLAATAGYAWQSGRISLTNWGVRVEYHMASAGVRYRPYKPLWISLYGSIPFYGVARSDDSNENLSKRLSSAFRIAFEADYRIRGAFGIKLTGAWTYSDTGKDAFPTKSIDRIRLNGYTVLLASRYEMDF
jgi:TolB-like protein